jgi:hypothetical protein
MPSGAAAKISDPVGLPLAQIIALPVRSDIVREITYESHFVLLLYNAYFIYRELIFSFTRLKEISV